MNISDLDAAGDAIVSARELIRSRITTYGLAGVARAVGADEDSVRSTIDESSGDLNILKFARILQECDSGPDRVPMQVDITFRDGSVRSWHSSPGPSPVTSQK